MNPRPLTLREYGPAQRCKLSQAELDALLKLKVLSIAPTAEQGVYDLSAGSTIGTIVLPERSIDIQPKLPISSVLFMLSYGADQEWDREPFEFGYVPLTEIIVRWFAHQLQRALGRGLLCGYRSREESLAVVRGRWRIDDQIRQWYGRYPPLEVTYDEFTEDIEENRLIKAALARLRRVPLRSPKALQMLHHYDAQLAPVQLVEYDTRRLPDITYTRLNEHYRPAVELAKLVLRSISFELHRGSLAVSSFLFDMNTVFETFVVTALREALRLPESQWPPNAKGRALYLDAAQSLKLEPDISWWDGGRCVFVGDVKYKRVDPLGRKHADVYQLLAYCTATGLPQGMLIYAAGEAEPVQHSIRYAGKLIEVVAIDPSGKPDRLLSEIARIAGRIRQMRAAASSMPHERDWEIAPAPAL